MKSFGKTLAVFLIFFIGTLTLIHVDRQCGLMNGKITGIEESLENLIER